MTVDLRAVDVSEAEVWLGGHQSALTGYVVTACSEKEQATATWKKTFGPIP